MSSSATLESIPGYSEFRGQAGHVYNEAAFRYFLAVDLRRAERSTRSVLLVLVTVQRSPGGGAKLTDATAAALFTGLRASLREVDFVGWYREGQVAAAVLPQGMKKAGGATDRITARVLPALRKRLSAEEAETLRVRVVRLGAGPGLSSE